MQAGPFVAGLGLGIAACAAAGLVSLSWSVAAVLALVIFSSALGLSVGLALLSYRRLIQTLSQ